MNNKSDIMRMNKKGYTGPRPDILKLIADSPERILDIGCGSGSLGAAIKLNWKNSVVIGVDNDEQLLSEASTRLDKAIYSDLNNDHPLASLDNYQPFDVIIFADILEHLVHPERIISEARNLLKPAGYIITSIPNVRHYSTFITLGLKGTWPRRERGIHDKTHLRFFARKDIISLLEECGFKMVEEKRNVRLIEAWPWTNIPGKLFDFLPFRPFLTFQYLHRSIPY